MHDKLVSFLIISEGTVIAHKASGLNFHIPGIWSEEQVSAWKKVRFFLRLLLSRSVFENIINTR